MKKILLIIVAVAVSLSAEMGKDIVKEHGCMKCHAVKKRSLGPSFKKIAKKNIKWYKDDAKSNIMKTIKEGSRGKYRYFSDTTMPAHEKISDFYLGKIADWILETNKKSKKERFF